LAELGWELLDLEMQIAEMLVDCDLRGPTLRLPNVDVEVDEDGYLIPHYPTEVFKKLIAYYEMRASILEIMLDEPEEDE
jgi:hypothetical protein